MSRAEVRRLIRELQAMRPCSACGTRRSDRSKGAPPRIGSHPSILASWRCPECGGSSRVVFELSIGKLEPEPPWVRERRAELGRKFAAEGVTPTEGWEIREDLANAMDALGIEAHHVPTRVLIAGDDGGSDVNE